MSHHLDNLVFFLENPDELSDGENVATEGVEHLDETIGSPEDMETQTMNESQSSTPRPRRSVVRLYRRSSSASQYILKNKHCFFCNLEPNQLNFENHLRVSPRCLSLYERKLKVKDIEGVLVSLFPCLFCNATTRLQYHLERHPSCRDKYFQRWGVDVDDGADASQLNQGIRVVTAKVKAIKRSGQKSRGQGARAKENKTLRMTKKEMKNIENCLNEFKMKTALGNYAKCVLCKSNKLISEVEVLEESVVSAMECLSDENYTILRRAEKYFKCSSCTEGSVKSFTYPDRMIIEMEAENNEEGLLLVPRLAGSVPAAENGIQYEEEKKKTILFPTEIDALKVAPHVSAKTLKDIQLLVYGDKMLRKTELSLLYQNQLSKYQSVKCTGDFFFGKIKNEENKTLTSVKKHTSDGYIRGSDRWVEIQEDNLSTMFREFGRMAIKLEVELSTNSNDVLATTIMQQGIAVSINFEGDATQEQSALYFVHTGHSAAEDCGQNCRKVKLQEYMQTFEGKSAPSTFLACIHQKLEALKSLIQCPASNLCSKEFHFNIHFTQTGMAVIRGVLWPAFLEEINYLRLLHGVNSDEVLRLEQEITDKIDKVLSTSTDKVVIREQFEISENAAETIFTLVQENQIHIEDDSLQSPNVPLPSLKTLIKMVPRIEENIRTSLRFRKKMQKCLQELSAHHKRILTTEEFLQQIWDNNLVSSHLIDRRIWKIIIDEEEFDFYIEPRLRAMNDEFGDNIGGAYHFALGCASASESFSIVLRRLRLVECYTDSYSPIFLKAFASPMSMEPLNGMGSVDWKLQQETRGESTVKIEGHKEISILEAVSLVDSRKCRLCSSRSTEFVFSVQNKHIYLKKVPENNDECYKIDGDENVYYEKQNNMITRYFMRLNGQEMILSEFATNYDYVGKTQSEELYKIYHDKLDNITESSEKSVIGKAFPDIIICSNKDIMKRRRNFKILTYPNLMEENEVKYSKTLLYFYPLETLEDLATSVDNLFSMPADDGSQRTVVNNNERMFLLKRRKQGGERV